MIAFALILILLAAIAQYVLTKDSLRFVKESFSPDEKVAEPDHPFYLHVTLKNTGRWFLSFLRFSLYLPEEFEPLDKSHCTLAYDKKGQELTYTTWLRPYGESDFRIPVKISKRGRYVFRPLCLYGGDFLGIRQQTRKYAAFREVVIPPKEASETKAVIALSGFLGDISVRRFICEDPILHAGFREYTGQEPLKKISWTQSAKGRGLMVKIDDFTAEPTVSVIVNVDTHAAPATSSLEACYRLARTICRTLEEKRIPYELVSNTFTAGGWYDEHCLFVQKGFGTSHFEKVLEFLGRCTDTAALSENDLIRSIAASKQINARILITTISGMPNTAGLHLLREASGGNLLILTPENTGAAHKESAEKT